MFVLPSICIVEQLIEYFPDADHSVEGHSNREDQAEALHDSQFEVLSFLLQVWESPDQSADDPD